MSAVRYFTYCIPCNIQARNRSVATPVRSSVVLSFAYPLQDPRQAVEWIMT
ncbi:hypothetical protein K3B24_003402 [Proteus mirabilis]|nr:hypothetical protein [Proteus mirabilis]